MKPHTDKQSLLRRHRRHKRLGIGLALVVMLVASALLGWWLLPVLLVGLWLVHEAWLADHRFYHPRQDDCYSLKADWRHQTQIQQGQIQQGQMPWPEIPAGIDTLVLALEVKANPSGYLLDPWLELAGQRFTFEPGCKGLRYLTLAVSQLDAATEVLDLKTCHCRLGMTVDISGFSQPDFHQRRLLILAPHADDAELAAFGLYQQADEVMILTLTQGETKADAYRALGLDAQGAARLKGRLRTWDSQAIPLWGGVPQTHCLQLGYYCLQLGAMRAAPGQPQASRDSGDCDTRPARRHNALSLPGDSDGQPTWNNLVADLATVIAHFGPQAILLPHPYLDPHPDHVAAGQALAEALTKTPATCNEQIEHFLLYANHLHNTDLWPMGPAGGGVCLPPSHGPKAVAQDSAQDPDQDQARFIWLHPLSPAQQMDKAMALAMQHDLQAPLPLKQRLRRLIQSALTGRRWPDTGTDDYFRKAVRSGELFFIQQSLNTPVNTPVSHREQI